MKLNKRFAAAVLALTMAAASGCTEDTSQSDKGRQTDTQVSQTQMQQDESIESSSEAGSVNESETTTTTTQSETETSSSQVTTTEQSTTSTTAQTTAAQTTSETSAAAQSTTVTAKKAASSAEVWNYNGQCRVTIPESWKGRYVVEGNAIFCKKAHTNGTSMGELFRIVAAARPDDSAEYNYVLGSDAKNNYYFAVINTGLLADQSDKAAVSEMQSMYSQVESVIKNVRCAGTPKSAPVKYYGHGNYNPRSGMEREGFDPFDGYTVTEMNAKNKNLKVTGRFDSKDHSFTFTDSKGKSYKGWYVKKIDDNNPRKAIPFGLVFLNGCVYEYSCPLTPGGVSISIQISNSSVDASGYYKNLA